jgi:hypothetical protein
MQGYYLQKGHRCLQEEDCDVKSSDKCKRALEEQEGIVGREDEIGQCKEGG